MRDGKGDGLDVAFIEELQGNAGCLEGLSIFLPEKVHGDVQLLLLDVRLDLVADEGLEEEFECSTDILVLVIFLDDVLGVE